MRQAPSMTSLRAYDAVLRHGTLSGAARELCVTPAAISHRIRDLERLAGQSLTLRRDGQFQATALGREIQAALGDAFTRIREADKLLSSLPRKQTLHIAAAYSFAVLWLLPNLHRFETAFPDVEIFLDPTHDPLSTLEDGTDFVILHSNAMPKQGAWKTLFQDHCAAFCRTDHPVLDGHLSPTDLLRSQRLIHISHRSGPAQGEFSWAAWAAALDIVVPSTRKGMHVTAEHVAAELVAQTDAIALLGVTNAHQQVAEGSLHMIPGTRVPSGHSYGYYSAAPDNPATLSFQKWLREMFGR